MKFFEKMKQKKADNKGFSLVELIIVIAIMAILVGIVGTQVIPYLNRSREAKDFQIINSYSTAAMTTYSSNPEDVVSGTPLVIKVYGSNTEAAAVKFEGEIKELTGYADETVLQGKMSSDKGKTINTVEITINVDTKKITTQAYDSTGNKVFDEIVAEL